MFIKCTFSNVPRLRTRRRSFFDTILTFGSAVVRSAFFAAPFTGGRFVGALFVNVLLLPPEPRVPTDDNNVGRRVNIQTTSSRLCLALMITLTRRTFRCAINFDKLRRQTLSGAFRCGFRFERWHAAFDHFAFLYVEN